MRSVMPVIITILIVAILLIGVSEMPEFGNPNNPSNNEVYKRYIEESVHDTGSLNGVTSIVLNYRSFDTLGEAIVLFMGVITVVLLLDRKNEG